jgi:hypothetical protein
MFEKSKSAITFKEFESKMNIVNNFDSDWGHFCDTDIFNTNTNTNANNFNQLFQNNLQKPKKRDFKIKLPEKIEAQEQAQEQAQEEDIEEQKQELEKNNYEDNKIITVIEKIMNCIQMTFITLTIAYFIFKVI